MKLADLKIEECVEAKKGLLRRELLRDFPMYRPVFDQFAIPANMNHMYWVESIKRTIGKTFDAELTIHRLGEMRSDLAHLGRPTLPPEQTTAFTARFGPDMSKVFIAVEGDADRRGKVKTVDIGSVVRQYGHYVEERHRAWATSNKASDNISSWAAATRWVKRNYPEMDGLSAMLEADGIAAWMNAIWLSWLFSVDQRHIVVGMTLDAVRSPGVGPEFVTTVLPFLHEILTDRSVAFNGKHWGSAAPEFDRFFELGDEESRCRLIDEASAKLILRLPDLERKGSRKISPGIGRLLEKETIH